MLKRTITLCLLIAHVALLYATTLPNCPLRGHEIYQSFKNIELPFESNTVQTIFQDSIGMMWFGTRNGLYNYNGH